MTLNERALIHGKAALESPDAEALRSWKMNHPDQVVRSPELYGFVVPFDLDTVVDRITMMELALVMYAQDVAEGRHT